MTMKQSYSVTILLTICACVATSVKFAKGFDSSSMDGLMKLKGMEMTGIPRELQLGDFNMSSLSDLGGYFFQECGTFIFNTSSLEDFSSINYDFDPDFVGFALCLKRALLTLLEGCFGHFPGVWDPFHCTFELMITKEVVQTLFDLFSPSVGGNFTNSTSDSFALLDAVEELGFYEYFTVLTPLQNLNGETCEILFGTSDHPKFHSCLHLFNEKDLSPFLQGVANGFKGFNGCAEVTSTFKLGSGGLDPGPNVMLPTGFFDGFNQNFATCSKFDDGALGNALTDQFATGSATINQVTLLVLTLSLIAAYALLQE